MGLSFTSREFNQDAGRAKRASRAGPVFITDRGRPAHVLMTVEEYERLTGGGASIVDLLGGSPAAAVDLTLAPARGHSLRPADLA